MNKVPPRKYFTEVALNLHTKDAYLLPPDQLHVGGEVGKKAEEMFKDCHIYLILRRPRLAFDPTSFKYGDPESTGHFIRKVGGEEERIEFWKKIRVASGGKIEVGPYPHRALVISNPGEESRYVWAHTESIQMHLKDDTLRDFEVIYVGQAFGDGTRTAFTRLKSHATLQQILAEQAQSRPDDEVMLLLVQYQPPVVHMGMDGASKSEESGEKDTQHFLSILDNPPSEKEQIGIAEAALIRYFAPEYNEKFKKSFPHDQLKVLEGCYEYDFAGLTVEINTEEFPLRLWSPATKGPGYHHIAQFDLHDPDRRRSFFTIFDKDGSLVMLDTSGPAF